MATRTKILAAFRNIHKARRQVFNGDEFALQESRIQMNEEFRKHLTPGHEAKSEELLEYANDVARIMRKTIVQVIEKEDGVFELRPTKDTVTIKNKPFNPDAEIPLKLRRRKSKCGEIDHTPLKKVLDDEHS